MSTPPFREFEFVAMITARAASRPRPATVVLGIGDDAAVLRDAGRPRVFTTDLLLDGIDFVLRDCGPAAAGRKAMAKNLSDVAAMGSRPESALVSVALPPGFDRTAAELLLDGLFAAADPFGCAIVGGDTKRSSGPLVIGVALTGVAPESGPVLRSGARTGDLLFVTGRLGGSTRGRHLAFEPRVAEAIRLAEHHHVRAMLDLSDGLSTDLARLCSASGVGARIDAAAIPISPDAVAEPGRTALERALDEGEDYELLFAIDPHSAAALAADSAFACGVTRIGECTKAAERVTIVTDGVVRPLIAHAFEHTFERGSPER